MLDTTPSSDEATKRCDAEDERFSNSTPKPKASDMGTNKSAASRRVPAEERQAPVFKNPVRVLIVGPSGSGKTCVINDSYCGRKEPMGEVLYKATKHIEITHMDFEGHRFELLDTPGFDSVSMSDVEAFVELASYFLDPKRVETGINGIIYVHRAGNTVYSRSLLRNFRVLTKVLLGDTGVARLTFLVTQDNTPDLDYRRLLAARGSAFNAAFSAGAKFAPNPNRAGLAQLLRHYASQEPIILPIQTDELCRSRVAFVTRVEKELGYYEFNSAQSLLDDQERQLREIYDQKLANQSELEAQLHQELQKCRQEYSSLRSQLQLQENVEQSQVVQTLRDINRMIDDIGRSVSAYLTDNYVRSTFGKDATRVTALHSRDRSTLMDLFAHQEGRSSLIAHSNGQGMRIEEFLDYSIRHFLCEFLAIRLFRPFHPGIDTSLSKALLASYENIQNREPQAIAGKWRAETFKSLHRAGSDGSRASEEQITSLLDALLTRRLRPLVKSVFGRDIPLEDAHTANLRSLIRTAWDWNSSLKGEVIMLGDFVQTYFPRTRFDAEQMEEFEAISPDHVPSAALGTLALGLVCRRAAGGGNPINGIVVCKAVVATRTIFN
ncbi:unnamed protein product [Rhizoctonia solani]|uniref:G domain-containing protein n=1 Tax=Rhizoctonia solani TaxID=456999 RepID=A0A8H3CU41_9AGAM|nr:unnamed protein product [Rhizoctonia solani]